MSSITRFERAASQASGHFEPAVQVSGKVTKVQGQAVYISGLSGLIACGDLIRTTQPHAKSGVQFGEVIALEASQALAMMFGSTEGIKTGQAVYRQRALDLRPSEDWIGRVLNYQGQTLDGLSPKRGFHSANLRASPPVAVHRKSLGPRFVTGIAALDTFLPFCSGQRMGLFAGSGVGKSTLLGTLAQRSTADINIIALIGERGREVRHFVDHVLGEAGMRNTIVFVATSDEASAVKLRTAQLAMATAEIFRDQGQHVMIMFDSLTRYAEAHRDLALTAGETPSLRAYPPSTFHSLAALCERSGPGLEGRGDITALFSVLVAGSDMEEPVADMVRGILDGHIILDRDIAERGRYPAIDLRRSVSRSLPGAASEKENALLAEARRYIGLYEEAQTLITAGLYVTGSDAETDRAIACYPQLDHFLSRIDFDSDDQAYEALERILKPSENKKSQSPLSGPSAL